jgi:fucose permease
VARSDSRAVLGSPSRRSLLERSPRLVVTAVFSVHAFLVASWTAHIPHVKAHLHLTDASLGIALLGSPIGSITAMMLSGYLLPRLGSRLMVRLCLLGYCLAGPLVGAAGSLLQIFLALAIWGAFQGALDVSMNTQAISVERGVGRPIMSRLHGCWSIGAFCGAGFGALAVGVGLSLRDQLALLGLVVLLVVLPLLPRLVSDLPPEPHHASEARRRVVHPTIVVLAGICFACLLCEGAAADWGAVYLHGSLGATPAIAALGYAAFSLAMVTLRLSGDRLLVRYRPSVVLPVFAVVASVGLGVALLLGSVAAGIIGFAALGLGVASVVPTAFSAAGRVPGLNPGTAVATVASLGWAGMVSGPPLIGQLASWSSLPVALGLLPLLTLVVAIAASRSRILDVATEVAPATPG